MVPAVEPATYDNMPRRIGDIGPMTHDYGIDLLGQSFLRDPAILLLLDQCDSMDYAPNAFEVVRMARALIVTCAELVLVRKKHRSVR